MARHADVTFVDISNIVNDPSVPNIEDLVEDPESFVCGFMINGSLYPVSQRTAGEDGKYRSLRIESKRDIRLFVEVQATAVPLSDAHSRSVLYCRHPAGTLPVCCRLPGIACSSDRRSNESQL